MISTFFQKSDFFNLESKSIRAVSGWRRSIRTSYILLAGIRASIGLFGRSFCFFLSVTYPNIMLQGIIKPFAEGVTREHTADVGLEETEAAQREIDEVTADCPGAVIATEADQSAGFRGCNSPAVKEKNTSLPRTG